jgi:hypothetical protein
MTDDEPKYIGDDFIEEDEVAEQDDLENQYDLVLPPGVPHKVIIEAADKFNLEVTTRKCALKTIDIEPENLLVLRGDLETVNKAYDFIYQKMAEQFNYKKDTDNPYYF